MAKIEIEKPVQGIDQLNDETALEGGYLRSAKNVDIDAFGNIGRRKGFSSKLADSSYHSIYTPKRGGIIVCKRTEFGIYNPYTNAFISIRTMPGAYVTSYAELNDNLYCFNSQDAFYLPPDSVVARKVGVDLPALEPTFITTSGGLLPGSYAIAYTVVDDNGEESGLSDVVTIDLPDGGGITASGLMSLAGYTYRFYLTTANGEELRQATSCSGTAGSCYIGVAEDGRLPATKNLAPLPYGHFVRTHNSRLFVASKDFVYFSRAFNPHLHNPAYDYVPLVGTCTMLEPLDSGVFIGDSKGVKFYKGEGPDEYEVIDVSAEAPIYGTALAVAGEHLEEPFDQFDRVIIWLTQDGYQVGTPSGEVVRLHSDRVRLPLYRKGSSVLVLQDGRKQVVTSVDSNERAAPDVAVDSQLI